LLPWASPCQARWRPSCSSLTESIGNGQEPAGDHFSEIASLYDKLEQVILPLFYRQPTAFAQVMRSAIALNGSFFNTHRMVLQYLRNAYFAVEG
jgi:hypothetical protein